MSAKEAYIAETPILSSPPGTPISGWTKSYFHLPLNCFVFYDQVRTKWLSDLIIPIEVGRNGNVGVGNSFRTFELATSANPILLERNMCLIGISATTANLEQFVIRVDDVAAGSGTTTAINYEAVGPTSTQVFTKLDLNANYNAGDRLDIYVLSSVTGTITNPRLRLLFRYRV